MATIEAKVFKGILTKGNLVSGDPNRDGEVFVKDAVNCILNKGDLLPSCGCKSGPEGLFGC